MKIFVNNKNQIIDVGNTEDPSLKEIYVNENLESFPFKGWSTAKICCYMVNVSDGVVTMYTPYRPSSTLDYIDEIGHIAENNEEKAEAFDILIGNEVV